MNLNGIFYGNWEAESKFIDSNEDCDKAFGYDELHLTSNTIEKLKHGKDLIVDIQGGEYVLRIMWKEEQDPCNTCGYEEGSIYCKEHCPHEARELAKLPPVTLQPKTGRWVVDLQTATENYYICSECGRRIHLRYPDTIDNYPYCHCGAQMVEL